MFLSIVHLLLLIVHLFTLGKREGGRKNMRRRNSGRVGLCVSLYVGEIGVIDF